MKVFLAGAITSSHHPGLKGKYKLWSALHEQKIAIKMLGHFSETMIDSGAHSWNKTSMWQVGSPAMKSLPNLENHAEAYKKMIRDNLEEKIIWVELDVYAVKHKKWIDDLYAEVKSYDSSVQYMRVYHPTIDKGSMDTLREWIGEGQDYIGIGNDGLALRDEFFKITEDNKIKVHGFAMTKLDLMKAYPFYSVDSHSWKTGSMYGILQLPFKRFQTISLSQFYQLKKQDQENINSHIASIGFPGGVDELMADTTKTDICNIYQMEHLKKSAIDFKENREMSFQGSLFE